jgi:hypothetical protein
MRTRAPSLCALLLLGLALNGVQLVARAALADEVPANAVLGEFPFLDYPEPNRIVIDLAPDGSERPLPLMLDTGASDTVITPLMARELGVTIRRTKHDPYRRPTRLGRDLLFYVDDRVSDTGSKTGWEYGLLGGNFLEEYVVELDFERRVVRLLDPERYETPGLGATLPGDEVVLRMPVPQRRPLVELAVNGHPLAVLLDTGAPDSMVLSGKAARSVGIPGPLSPHVFRSGTTMGPMDIQLAEASSVKMGAIDVGPMGLFVAPRGWYNIAGANDSVAGFDLVSMFTLRLDYPRGRLWGRRLPDARARLFGVEWSGIKQAGVLFVGGPERWVAQAVLPGSIAEAIGLRAGDAIELPAKPDAVLGAIAARRAVSVLRIEDGIEGPHTLDSAQAPSASSGKPAEPR